MTVETGTAVAKAGGQIGLTAEQSSNLVLSAQTNAAAGFDVFAMPMAQAMDGLRGIAANAEEMAGALAVVSDASATPDRAGTKLKALGTSLSKDKRFRNLNLQQSVDLLQTMSVDDQQKVLASSEAMAAFRALDEDEKTFQKETRRGRRALDASGTSRSLIRQDTAASMETLGMRERTEMQRQKVREEKAKERMAVKRFKQDAAQSEAVVDVIKEGHSPLAVAAGEMAGEGVAGMSGSETMIGTATRFVGRRGAQDVVRMGTSSGLGIVVHEMKNMFKAYRDAIGENTSALRGKNEKPNMGHVMRFMLHPNPAADLSREAND